MKRFQLLTTAIFLFCTLLIAGCHRPRRRGAGDRRPGGDADGHCRYYVRHPDRRQRRQQDPGRHVDF